jgi:hypothetical protein
MNDLTKTLTFVGVALVMLAAAAAATWLPSRGGPDTAIAEFKQGEPFFPEFTDPLAATSLEVIEYDESTASQRPFKVELRDGKWTIPSHYDYPADGKDRLAKTAGGVIDLKKDTVRSISAEDHEALGVIDPLDPKSTALKGRGKRVTLKDKTGKVLADFIIGKSVKEREGQRYVRVPEQKVTYGVQVDVDLSTKFADWIETNLLQIDTSQIRRITFDSTKADLDQGIIPGETYTIARKDSSSPWTIEGLADDQEVATDKMSDLTVGLGDVKIVGVRPKPAGLSRDLSFGQDITPTQQTVASLVNKGFYPTQDKRLLSNQGEVQVSTDEGVVYTLRFGEATFATGQALSAGSEDETPKKADTEDTKNDEKKDETKSSDSDAAGGSRYLMVTVRFDESLIPKPDSLLAAETPSELPRDVFQRDEQEQKDEQAKLDREKADYQKKIEDGKKKAEELSERFAAWYYLTPDSAFRKIALERSAAIRKKAEPSATQTGTGTGIGPLPPN